MNYNKHYNTLIERAKNRLLEGYCEKHHIIPKCMGGSDDTDNLVALTPEEHYVAHQLLVKIYPNNPKLIYAANMMTVANPNQPNRNNKKYGWIKRKVSEASKTRIISDETRAKISASKLGKKRGPLSDEQKAKMSKALKGKKRTKEHNRKIGKSGKGVKHIGKGPGGKILRKPMTQETKDKISAKAKGRKLSEEHKAAIAAGQLGKKRPRKIK